MTKLLLTYIKELPSEEERVEYIKEVIEEDYFKKHPQWVAELDKSWDALHRSLTDGQLAWDNGEYPLNHVIFGGEILCANGSYIIVLKTKEQVSEIAKAINKVTERGLRAQYFLLNPEEYNGEIDEEDFEYTWQWFEDSKGFWQKAALKIETFYLLLTNRKQPLRYFPRHPHRSAAARI